VLVLVFELVVLVVLAVLSLLPQVLCEKSG